MKLFGRPIKYYFNIKNIRSYIRGTSIADELPKHYMEQFMLRYTHPDCQQCVKDGVCVQKCKCRTYEKMLDPKSECEGKDENGYPYWGPMVTDPKAWEEWKELVGLEFSQERTKVKRADDGSK